MRPWIQEELPRYKRRAKKPKSEDAVLLTPKFLKILLRRYVVMADNPDDIKSLIDYFYVPKATDIRRSTMGRVVESTGRFGPQIFGNQLREQRSDSSVLAISLLT
jgi:hypothetical protein